MTPTYTGGGTDLAFQRGGEHVSRLVKTPQMKENFSKSKKFSYKPSRYNEAPSTYCFVEIS